MKNIFENVINNGDYDLSELLKKIDTYHVEGKLTDAERDELYAKARKTPVARYDYATEINKLWDAVRALQGKETEAEPKEYVQPTGAHDAYSVGDKVIFGGKVYVCVTANCVWSPVVYPSAWELVE